VFVICVDSKQDSPLQVNNERCSKESVEKHQQQSPRDSESCYAFESSPAVV